MAMSSSSKKRPRSDAEAPRAADVVCPGELLGSASEMVAGDGTHVWGGLVYASIFGKRIMQAGTNGVPQASVVARRRRRRAAALPSVGDTVTCRVTRLSPRMASVDIVCVNSAVLPEPCTGLVRREDILPLGVAGLEPAQVVRSFRLGDLILARVISLGDARSYFLTTAAPELGVVVARSAHRSARMVPVAYNQMECPLTKEREWRKCAKPPAAPAPASTAHEVGQTSQKGGDAAQARVGGSRRSGRS